MIANDDSKLDIRIYSFLRVLYAIEFVIRVRHPTSMFITRALFITLCDGKGHIWFPISGQEEIEQRYLVSRGCNVGKVQSTPSSEARDPSESPSQSPSPFEPARSLPSSLCDFLQRANQRRSIYRDS